MLSEGKSNASLSDAAKDDDSISGDEDNLLGRKRKRHEIDCKTKERTIGYIIEKVA